MPEGLRRARPWLIALLAGAAVLVAHPPVGWWWASFAAPALLVFAVHLDPGRAGRLGIVAGVVAYGPMLSWLILPAGVLGWGLLVAIQAATLGLVASLLRPWLLTRWLPLAAALAWTGIDAWRAVFPLGGFEWGALAYAHADGTFLLPVARVLGSRGITLLTVLIGVAALEAVRRGRAAVRDRGTGSVEDALRSTNWPIGLLVGGLLVGVLVTVEPPPEVGELDVLSVQGNDTGPDDVRPADAPLVNTTAMRDLTLEALDDDVDVVVWPESSVDRDPVTRDPRLGALVAEVQSALPAGATLLAGMNLDGPDPDAQFVNAIVALDREGEVDRYVKRQPVPFGEYVPLRRYLGWFPPLRQIPRDAVRGEAGQTVEVTGTTVAVGICFETMFGGILRESVIADDEPAGLVVLVTNNASFGRSAQPDQHVAQSQLRAVETGRWVVHGALSGATAFISPDGTVTERTELFTRTTLRATLPVVAGRTPFLVVGDVLGLLTRGLVLLGAAVAVVGASRARRRRSAPAAGEPGPAR